MAGSIDILGFTGMQDVATGEGFYADVQAKICRPAAVLNCDVDLNGRLVKRLGKTLSITLANSHSLWAGISCMLCAASGTLYRLNGSVATSIGSLTGPTDATLSYEEVDDLIYISTPYWCKIFNPADNSLSAWGVSQPVAPLLSSTTGSLPVGTYYVTMTNVTSGELSGNGAISTITLSSIGGISISNRPSGAIVWCTDQNEGIFYRVGEVSAIVDIPTTEPLPSFLCSPAPYLTNLCYAFGLMWGSISNVLYYSQPFHPTWFRLNLNTFTFDSAITLIARCPTGLFIGMSTSTIFLHGTEPEKMIQISAGAGSIPGTLTYCNNVPELGDILGTAEKGYVDVPAWRTTEGIVLGNASGKLFNLTKNRLKMDSSPSGASLYRNYNGTLQLLSSSARGLTGSSVGELNADTLSLFTAGKVSASEYTNKGMGTTGSLSETVTCTVTRGGVVI
jgi:hypothetical protein